MRPPSYHYFLRGRRSNITDEFENYSREDNERMPTDLVIVVVVVAVEVVIISTEETQPTNSQ